MWVTPWSLSARTTIWAPVNWTDSWAAGRSANSVCVFMSPQRAAKDKGAFPPLDHTPSSGHVGLATFGRRPPNKYDKTCHGRHVRVQRTLRQAISRNKVVILSNNIALKWVKPAIIAHTVAKPGELTLGELPRGGDRFCDRILPRKFPLSMGDQLPEPQKLGGGQCRIETRQGERFFIATMAQHGLEPLSDPVAQQRARRIEHEPGKF